jgi:hypothetical protein
MLEILDTAGTEQFSELNQSVLLARANINQLQ